MGHLTGKDLYHSVGKKLDGLEFRAPMNEHLYKILQEVFTPLEAEVFCQMPYTMSDKKRLVRIVKMEESELEKLLTSMSSKGLIMDMYVNGANQYMPSPLIIGLFEFTMMRAGDGVDSKKLAKLFHDYLHSPELYEANLTRGEKVSALRALPYEQAVSDNQFAEILDYEKAQEIIEGATRFAVGICSCRHEKHHLGEKECDATLDICTSFNLAADTMIRSNLAKEATKSQALENLTYAAEKGMVLLTDNVKKNVSFLCHCCGCCCNALGGISKFGYPNMVVTSTFIAGIDEEKCNSCGRCAKACPINAIKISEHLDNKKLQVDTAFCLGCGVCTFACEPKAMSLIKRGKRVLHPENTFERILLQCLEKGTLQNQLFDDQSRLTMKFMSGFVGGFLRLPPVKKALMSDLLRSSFLTVMRKGVQMQGKGWLDEL